MRVNQVVALIFIGLTAVYFLGAVWARGFIAAYVVWVYTGIDERWNLATVMAIGFAIGGTSFYRYFRARLDVSLMKYRMTMVDDEDVE